MHVNLVFVCVFSAHFFLYVPSAQATIPEMSLSENVKIPVIGFGTWNVCITFFNYYLLLIVVLG